jgi:GR25 family glycosyltransferase involved in LPS biosynthesis
VSSNQKYKCFIIHLKRAKKRKAYVDEIISKLNIETEIIEAVDGKLLTKNKISQFYSETPLFQPAYPFKINKGEIGCFLSFRKAWQNIVDENLSGGLIFEDDVSLNIDEFQHSFNTALRWIKKYGYIQFQVRDIPKKSEIIKIHRDVQLLKPSPTLLRCSAQLVSYSTAKRLLKITEKFDRPVDGLLQLNWGTGVDVTAIRPSGVLDNTYASGGSNLSLNIPLSLKIKQEFSRIKYRYYIKKYTNIHNNL